MLLFVAKNQHYHDVVIRIVVDVRSAFDFVLQLIVHSLCTYRSVNIRYARLFVSTFLSGVTGREMNQSES